MGVLLEVGKGNVDRDGFLARRRWLQKFEPDSLKRATYFDVGGVLNFPSRRVACGE